MLVSMLMMLSIQQRSLPSLTLLPNLPGWQRCALPSFGRVEPVLYPLLAIGLDFGTSLALGPVVQREGGPAPSTLGIRSNQWACRYFFCNLAGKSSTESASCAMQTSSSPESQ